MSINTLHKGDDGDDDDNNRKIVILIIGRDFRLGQVDVPQSLQASLRRPL